MTAHGTWGAVRQHYRAQEQQCPRCRELRNAYQRQWRASNQSAVDGVAVERRLGGDLTVRLNRAERRALVRLGHGRGMNDCEIARAAGMWPRTVLRIRQRLGLPANAPCTWREAAP